MKKLLDFGKPYTLGLIKELILGFFILCFFYLSFGYCEQSMSINDCELEYNLIPINSVDSSYCESNSLCSYLTGQDLSGTNWSAFYINGVQHVSSSVINITIPEEIDWDYTGNENSFDLTVKGYAVDSDYIQGIIDINSYQVTPEDFTNIFVNGLTLIFPYIIVVLFIVFIRKLIKKFFN